MVQLKAQLQIDSHVLSMIQERNGSFNNNMDSERILLTAQRTYAANMKELNNLYAQCKPLCGIQYAASLFDSVHFNENNKFLLQAAKLIALYFANGETDMMDFVRNFLIQIRNRTLCLNNKMQKSTIDLLLDACENKWEKIGLLGFIFERTECFHLLAGIALSRLQFDVFDELCTHINPKQKFFEFPNHPFWKNFLHCLSSNTAVSENLMHLLMDHLVSLQMPLKEEEFIHVTDIFTKFPKWGLAEAHISPELLECSHCGTKLRAQQTLDDMEFDKLKSDFTQIFKKRLSYQIVSQKSIVKFIHLLHEIEEEHPLQECTIHRRPLVVDGLNFFGGKPMPHKLDYFNNYIDTLLREGFAPILIIFKYFYASEFRKKFQQNKDVYFFSIDRLSNKGIQLKEGINDDLFILYSTMHLGPNTHILSNDIYENHEFMNIMNADMEQAFMIWKKSRLINFLPFDKGSGKNNAHAHLKMPSKFLTVVQGDKMNGYHIVRQHQNCGDSFWSHIKDGYSVYCVRMKY